MFSSHHWVTRYSTLILVAILCFAFFTRVYGLDKPKAYVFDEVYHAVTAKLMAQNDVRAFEWWNPPPEPNTAVDWLHPPLAKYTQAGFIKVFGETPFGWRISSAIFGLLVVAMTYSLTKELFDNEGLSLLAAFLVACDGLLLVQSRVAMNDIHVTFFMLLALTWYVKFRNTTETKWLWLSGVGAGLAVGSKWSGVFVIGIIGLFEALCFLRQLLTTLRHETLKKQARAFVLFAIERSIVLLLIPATLYLLSYTQMFLQGKSLFCFEQREVKNTCYLHRTTDKQGKVTEKYISHFQELHHQIWWYQTNLTATHTYQSRPWQWFLNARPVWFYVDYSTPGKVGNIYAFGNPALFWFGATSVIASLAYLLRELFKRRFKDIFGEFNPLLFVVVSYFMVWILWQFSPRIMFFYHYASAVPLLTIILSYWLMTLWNSYKPLTKVSKSLRKASATSVTQSLYTLSHFDLSRVLVSLAVISIAICFVVWYPHWTGMPIDPEFAKTVYFKFTSWK